MPDQAINVAAELPHPSTDAPSLAALVEVQHELARAGLDLGAVMRLITERTQHLTGAEGAVIEMAEGQEMVYRAASGSVALS